MSLLDKYLLKSNFDSYNDFYENYKVNIPENFNFAFDVVDELAREKPNDRALQWRDEKGAEAVFTFAEISGLSNKAANILRDYNRLDYEPSAYMLYNAGVLFHGIRRFAP